MLELDRIICGDCLDVLKTLPEDSVDAIVTDPPAGIAFMGKEWDQDKGGRNAWIGWMAQVASECLRVIKPGGHALVWALPRTSHWTGMAWEEAGWEPRDKIAHVFGSGFPKSLDISKALDKLAGAEREVIGIREDFNKRARKNGVPSSDYIMAGGWKSTPETVGILTAPATPAAKQWAGWGSALKPAHEDWWLFRKPLSESTIAANVLRWGCGALNIDGCRVGFANHADEQEAKAKNQHGDFDSGQRKNKVYGEDLNSRTNYNAPGRFPANLIWSHSPNCKRIGTKKVKGDKRGASGGKTGCRDKYDNVYDAGWHNAGESTSAYGDADGLEEVESWDCDPSCPSWQFAKAGERKSGNRKVTKNGQRDDAIKFLASKQTLHDFEGDTGSAARFFQSCPFTEEDYAPFIYQAKASRSERERGLDGLPLKECDNWPQSLDGNDPRGATPRSNNHPTVKPLALMRYLCRLITPPDGVVLDPFAGSGTTCMAAKMEGFRYIGIEKEPEYAEIARRRIATIPTSLSRWVEDARQ